jgi:hypothetical protein
MAVAYKVLGQQSPSATTQTQLYAVPSGKSAVVSTINICNRNSANATFRIAVQPANVAITNTHYLIYDTLIPSNDTISLALGISLGQTDVISVYANSATLTFSAFGSEIS